MAMLLYLLCSDVSVCSMISSAFGVVLPNWLLCLVLVSVVSSIVVIVIPRRVIVSVGMLGWMLFMLLIIIVLVWNVFGWVSV